MLLIFSEDLLWDMSMQNKHFTNISFSQWTIIVIPTVQIANYSTEMEAGLALILGAKFNPGSTWIIFR